jgi:hypothetical protein
VVVGKKPSGIFSIGTACVVAIDTHAGAYRGRPRLLLLESYR